MLLLSWNVNPWNQEARLPGIIEAISSVRPHIVTLQEVRSDLADDWAARLKDIGLGYHYSSGIDDQAKPYQCLIASRWNVTPDDIDWRRCAPYPELLGRTTVSVPDEGDVEVFTAHIPNGSGHGWKKIDTFHVLSAVLRGASDSPRILTGDFNEPELFLQSGQIVTFGEEGREDCGRSNQTWRDDCDDERPLTEWTNGVLSVLGGVSHHGLRDAYRDCHGFETTPPVTHWTTKGNPRYFDHAFVSRHFDVSECDYCDEWREQGLSDHSPMWAKLCLRTRSSEFLGRSVPERSPGSRQQSQDAAQGSDSGSLAPVEDLLNEADKERVRSEEIHDAEARRSTTWARVVAMLKLEPGISDEIASDPDGTKQGFVVVVVTNAAAFLLLLPIVLLTIPISIIGIAINAGLCCLFSRLFAGEVPAYSNWFRAVMFATAPSALGIVPIIGALVGVIYVVVLTVVVIRDLARITTGAAIVVWLIATLLPLILITAAGLWLGPVVFLQHMPTGFHL